MSAGDKKSNPSDVPEVIVIDLCLVNRKMMCMVRPACLSLEITHLRTIRLVHIMPTKKQIENLHFYILTRTLFCRL